MPPGIFCRRMAKPELCARSQFHATVATPLAAAQLALQRGTTQDLLTSSSQKTGTKKHNQPERECLSRGLSHATVRRENDEQRTKRRRIYQPASC
jgi:hypothetical protein